MSVCFKYKESVIYLFSVLSPFIFPRQCMEPSWRGIEKTRFLPTCTRFDSGLDVISGLSWLVLFSTPSGHFPGNSSFQLSGLDVTVVINSECARNLKVVREI